MTDGPIASIRDLVRSYAAALAGGLSPAARGLLETLESGALRADAFTAAQALRAAADGDRFPASDGPRGLLELEEAGVLVPLSERLFSVAHGLDWVYATRAPLPLPAAISGPSALNFWGLSEQVPLIVYCTVPAARGAGEAPRAAPFAGRVELPNRVPCEYGPVAPGAFFGVVDVPYDLGLALPVLDRERAMLDLLARPGLHPFGEAMTVLEENAGGTADPEKLISYAVRLGSPSVAGRLGWALEAVAPGLLASLRPEVLRALEGLAASGGGPRPALLDPSLPERGPAHPRWSVRVNLHGGRDGMPAAPAKRSGAG